MLFLKNFPYGSNLGQENCAVLPTVALSSTSVPDASESAGTLPRPKNSPPDCFCTSVRTGAGLSSPIIHQIPYKNRRYPKISPVFMGWIMGLEERGPPAGRVKKCPVDTFLARGRVPGKLTAVRRTVGSFPEGSHPVYFRAACPSFPTFYPALYN